MWNGFSMISKRPELTEGMMQTLVEAERTLLESPGERANPQQQTPTPIPHSPPIPLIKS